MRFDNGYRVNLGPLVGIDNDFNTRVDNINPNAPAWTQQRDIWNAAADDLYHSFLAGSSFYDPKRIMDISRVVTDNIYPTSRPGLSSQLMAEKLWNPAVDNATDFLLRPMEIFNTIKNTENFGSHVQVPVQMQATLDGTVIPVLPDTGAEALQFAAIGSLAPFFTGAEEAAYNPYLQQFPIGTPMRNGLPTTEGTVNVYPYRFDLRPVGGFGWGGLGIGAYSEANPIISSNMGNRFLQPRV